MRVATEADGAPEARAQGLPLGGSYYTTRPPRRAPGRRAVHHEAQRGARRPRGPPAEPPVCGGQWRVRGAPHPTPPPVPQLLPSCLFLGLLTSENALWSGPLTLIHSFNQGAVDGWGHRGTPGPDAFWSTHSDQGSAPAVSPPSLCCGCCPVLVLGRCRARLPALMELPAQWALGRWLAVQTQCGWSSDGGWGRAGSAGCWGGTNVPREDTEGGDECAAG